MLRTCGLLFVYLIATWQVPAVAQTQKPVLNPQAIQSLKRMNAEKEKQTSPQEASGQLQQKLVAPKINLIKKTLIRVQIDKDFPDNTSSVYTGTILFRSICEKYITAKVFDQSGKSHDLKLKYAKDVRKNDTCIGRLSMPTDLNYTVDARLDKTNPEMPIDRMYISPMQKTVALKADNPGTTAKFSLSRRN